ncbi:MAG: hypothetical protein ACP5N1_02325 [Candidatus Woesearchaeota archaeon]
MIKIYPLTEGIYTIKKDLRTNYPNIPIFQDQYIRFFAELISEFEEGRKTTTIRFLKNHIRIPDVNDEYMLPVMQTTLEKKYSGPIVGYVQIPEIYISKVKDFSEKQFKLNGYPTKKLGLEDLSEIYNHKFEPEDILSMYRIINLKRI